MKISLKCDTCGATLSAVEGEKDTYICSHCGHKQLIKEDQVHLHQNVIKTVYGNDKPSFDEYLEKAKTFVSLKEYKKAISVLNDAINDTPSDYRGWWYLANVYMTHHKETLNIDNFDSSDTYEDEIEDNLDKAMTLATDEERQIIIKGYQDWQEEIDKKLTAFEKKRYGKNISVPANYKRSLFPIEFQFYGTICLPIIVFIVTFIINVKLSYIIGLSLFAVLALISLLLALKIEKKITLKKEIKRFRLIGIEELKSNLSQSHNRFRSLNLIKTVKELIEQGDLRGYELKHGRIKKKYLAK